MLDNLLKITGGVIVVAGATFGATKLFLSSKKEKVLNDAVQRNAAHAVKLGEERLAQARAEDARSRKAFDERMQNLNYQEEASRKAHEARIDELSRATAKAIGELEELASKGKPIKKQPAHKPRPSRTKNLPIEE